ncbi:MAG: cysteine--tRNA ligase [Candidatus Pacebacteria bacterium]|nr:cysteine--tRNA ligase [Candidatus Paceibacterota bacterium]MBP9058497.1 cysteine--tRNA ligase [Candidatus Paceibacterota bacterium]MBP9770410.1 cysteine--tRNA ligase [Candidatus Paceibacterota bacterium]
MVLKFYNTIKREVEDFSPIDKEGKKVNLYTCGPTVYNFPHIGNYRAYIFTDTLKRTLLGAGYDVNHVMNLTDVDDKTIRNSIAEGKSLKEFTEYYTEAFFEDINKLEIIPAIKYPKATDYVEEMIKIIAGLLENGYAYQSAEGSIYFKISSFPDYGKLARIEKETLQDGASGRVTKDEYEKEEVQDFALWKAYTFDDGEVYWNSPFGKGRPGWHIECSAMSMALLGQSIDIHTGGKDNMFPHHENEIAQSECYSGVHPFVHYWMHNEYLSVDGKKMSKSLGNQYTIKDIEEKGFDPIVFRYLALQAHYRAPLNFTWDSLEASRVALNKLRRIIFIADTDNARVSDEDKDEINKIISDDLATPKLVAYVWENLNNENKEEAERIGLILYADEYLGLGLSKIGNVPDEITQLLETRNEARKNKDFQKSDEIRDQIKSEGFSILDNPDGTSSAYLSIWE